MCGRFSLSSDAYNSFIEFLDMGQSFVVPDRFNIAPSQPVAVLRLQGSDKDQAIIPQAPLPPREGALMRWGLIPHFAKEIKTDRPLINARSETIADKPSFRGPFPAGEDWLETVSLVTKPANGIVKKIHNRSPVIVAPQDYDLWMRPCDPPDRDIFSKLSTDLDKKLCMYEVSPYVNSARHDSEQCIIPASTDQFKLF